MKCICPVCGKTFDAVKGQHYCSIECRKQARQERRSVVPARKCEWCGKEFVPIRSTRRFCSPGCIQAARYWGSPEKAQRICPICGKTFSATKHNPLYCSDECRAIAKGTGRHTKTCLVCGKSFSPDSRHHKYCSEECSKEGSQRRKADLQKKYHDRRRYSGNREKVIARDMRQCAMCGATENLVSHDAGDGDATGKLIVHHLDESGSSPKRNDDPGNLVTLCRSCHAKVHTEQTHGWRKGAVVTVKCGYCGKEFTTPQHRIDADRGKYCSQECAYKAKLAKWVTFTCQHCGKEFTVLPSRARRGKVKYCSMACRKAAGYASRD